MSVHTPAMKICEKLKKMDSQICELKYGMMESNVPPPRHMSKVLPILDTGYVSKKSVLERKQFSTHR